MSKFLSAWAALILLLLSTSIAFAQQETKTLEAAKNNTLFENPKGDNSDGAGPAIFVGALYFSENNIRRGLIAFDIARAIPKGSRVTSVTLKLTLERTPNDTGQRIELHRVLTDWGEGSSDAFGGFGAPATEGDATWTHSFYKGRSWKRAGGDFSSTASGVQTVGGLGTYTWNSTPQMVADVQSWLDTPRENFGWLLRGNEKEQGTLKIFASRHSANASARPQLIINFRPPGK